jgi:crotonobetainyl-CoA:carnitine CoA-transferase CaiB-like acyl-CoA transferase
MSTDKSQRHHAASAEPAPSAGQPLPPLHGVRVLELAHWYAGPVAAGLLADWGADVIKVEPPNGDPMRRTGAVIRRGPSVPNVMFETANRGKRSVQIDMADPAGRQRFDELLDQAEILVTNLRPTALERLGLDDKTVLAKYPSLVYCALSAYGWDGPDRDLPGYDTTFMGRAAVMHMFLPRGSKPFASNAGIGDSITGLAASAGILAAYANACRTGQGRFVEVSLLRTGAWAIAGDAGIAAAGLDVPAPEPRTSSPSPLFNAYVAGDGRAFYLIHAGDVSGRIIPLLRCLGRADLIDDERFADVMSLTRNSAAVIAVFDEAFAARPMEYWIGQFAAHDVWWCPMQSPADLQNDAQAIANGAWVEVVDHSGRTVRTIDSPVRFDRTNRERTARAPTIGEHDVVGTNWQLQERESD